MSDVNDVDDKRVEAAARSICMGCEENPDHAGDARGNEFRWQDYRDTAIAAIRAADAVRPPQAVQGGEAAVYCHVYEYDSPLGMHKALYPKQWNGKLPDRTVPLYVHPAPAPAAVPAGYALVPVEPTPEMLETIFRNERDPRRAWAETLAVVVSPPPSTERDEAMRKDAERLDYLIKQPDDGPTLVVWKQDYKSAPFTTLRACGSINVTGHFEDVRSVIDAAMAAAPAPGNGS